MAQLNKITILIILLSIALSSNFGQSKQALKYNDEINFDVEINYLSGDKDDYKWLLIYKSGIVSEVMPMLKSSGIPLNEDITTPKLLLKVTVDHNFNNKSSEDNRWYYITSEIYLMDKIKLIDHPSVKIETITWRGDSTRTFISEKDVGNIRNEDIAVIAQSFIDDYLEINPD